MQADNIINVMVSNINNDFQYYYKKSCVHSTSGHRWGGYFAPNFSVNKHFFFSVNNSVFIDANLLCLSLAWKTRKTTHLSLLSTQKKSKASAYFAGTNLKRWHCLFLAWKDA